MHTRPKSGLFEKAPPIFQFSSKCHSKGRALLNFLPQVLCSMFNVCSTAVVGGVTENNDPFEKKMVVDEENSKYCTRNMD